RGCPGPGTSLRPPAGRVAVRPGGGRGGAGRCAALDESGGDAPLTILAAVRDTELHPLGDRRPVETVKNPGAPAWSADIVFAMRRFQLHPAALYAIAVLCAVG